MSIKFCVKTFLGKKTFWVKKIFGQKLWSKRPGSDFFCFEKTGRVNPRWRIYDLPPTENIRVKIVLDCC